MPNAQEKAQFSTGLEGQEPSSPTVATYFCYVLLAIVGTGAAVINLLAH